jgi:hypothetical protein
VRARAAGGALRALIAGGLVALVIMSGSPGAETLDARALSSTGAVDVGNTSNGQAILSTANLRPGGSASGTVTIANQGGASGIFDLEPNDLNNDPGPRGGRLGSALRLVVRDLGSSRVVYSGSLASLTSRGLGTWRPGESRTYRFDVSLPNSAPTVDNKLQGSAARIGFRWNARTAPDPPPTDTGSTPPPSGTGSTPPPTTVDPPAPADTSPPLLTLRAGKAQKLKRGSVKLKATCNETCRLVSASAKKSKLKAPQTLRPRVAAKVTVKLSSKDAKKLAKKIKKLKKRRTATLKLKITAADMAGNRGTATAKIKLKR